MVPAYTRGKKIMQATQQSPEGRVKWSPHETDSMVLVFRRQEWKKQGL